MNWRKIWWFVWKDDSLASLLVNIVIAIVLIKFVIYPVLGLVLGTSFPIVAVVSCSMQQEPTNCWVDCYMRGSGDLKSCYNQPSKLCGDPSQGSYWETCGGWYEEDGISKEEFSTFQQSKGFNIGDIFILRDAEEIKIGDVIVYNNLRNNAPIIHRVVEIFEDKGEIYYKTKGDNNKDMSKFEEKIKREQIHGKVLLKIPYLGWVKVGFNMLLKSAGII